MNEQDIDTIIDTMERIDEPTGGEQEIQATERTNRLLDVEAELLAAAWAVVEEWTAGGAAKARTVIALADLLAFIRDGEDA